MPSVPRCRCAAELVPRGKNVLGSVQRMVGMEQVVHV